MTGPDKTRGYALHIAVYNAFEKIFKANENKHERLQHISFRKIKSSIETRISPILQY